MTIHDHYTPAYKIAWNYIKKTNWIFIALQIIIIIAFPILEAVLRQVYSTDPLNAVLVIVYALHLVFGVLYLVLSLNLTDFIKSIPVSEYESRELALHRQIDEAQNRYRNLETEKTTEVKSLTDEKNALIRTAIAEQKAYDNQLEVLTLRSATINGSMSILQEILFREAFSTDIKEDLNGIMGPMILDMSRTLGFPDGALFNFGIYTPEGGNLIETWRSCDPRMTQHHRNWPAGHGYVGECFLKEKTLYTDDIKVRESKFAHPEDEEYYVSFLASPILPTTKEDGAPIGAIIITSNEEKQFSKEHRLLVETQALIISTYLTEREQFLEKNE